MKSLAWITFAVAVILLSADAAAKSKNVTINAYCPYCFQYVPVIIPKDELADYSDKVFGYKYPHFCDECREGIIEHLNQTDVPA